MRVARQKWTLANASAGALLKNCQVGTLVQAAGNPLCKGLVVMNKRDERFLLQGFELFEFPDAKFILIPEGSTLEYTQENQY